MKTCQYCRLSAIVVAGSIVFVMAAPATGQGETFLITQRDLVLVGQAPLPLGSDFDLVPTNVDLTLSENIAAQLGVFAEDEVEPSDPVPFEFAAEGMALQVRLTALGMPGFGGGLGNTIEFETMADLRGSGVGVANPNLPNLGFLNQIDSMSLLLGNLGGSFAQHDLGVDLDGDSVNETIRINNAIFAFFNPPGETPPGFDYTVDLPSNTIFNDGFDTGDISQWNTVVTIDSSVIPSVTLGAGMSVNPSVGLTLDTVEWTLTQDIVIPAVPEPSALSLGVLGALLVTLRRVRRGGLGVSFCRL